MKKKESVGHLTLKVSKKGNKYCKVRITDKSYIGYYTERSVNGETWRFYDLYLEDPKPLLLV